MLDITDAMFEAEVLKSPTPVVVDFWAPWCGPCKILSPIIEALAEEYKGKPIKFCKMNVDEQPMAAANYGILGIPTTIFFKGGKPADQLVGAQPKEKLQAKIDAILAAA